MTFIMRPAGGGPLVFRNVSLKQRLAFQAERSRSAAGGVRGAIRWYASSVPGTPRIPCSIPSWFGLATARHALERSLCAVFSQSACVCPVTTGRRANCAEKYASTSPFRSANSLEPAARAHAA